MSDNLRRILTLLGHLSAARGQGISVSQLVEQTGIANSTVYRLVHDLESLGYLGRDAQRGLVAKFQFEQGVVVGGIDLSRLAEACHRICSRLRVASEFIDLREENLFWHIAEEHPEQPIRLRAGVGYIRGTYELDSLSRMALTHLPPETVQARWDITNFYDVGVAASRIPWAEARLRLNAVDRADMQFDLMGNAKGVRRYCVAVRARDGGLAGLLTAAEAATPLRDTQAHVAHVRDLLLAEKTALEADEETTTAAKAGTG